MRRTGSVFVAAAVASVLGAGAAQAACDQVCGVIKQMIGARSARFAQFKGKDLGNGLWQSSLAPPGLNCIIADRASDPSELSCTIRGTSGVDYQDAQADQMFATLSHAVSAAAPGFKWFRVTKFDTPALSAPGVPASVSIVAQMRDEAGDTMLYIGPAAGDYFVNLSLDKMVGHSVELKISSQDANTGYPLAPYAPK